MDVFKDARAAAAFAPDKMKKVNLFDYIHFGAQ